MSETTDFHTISLEAFDAISYGYTTPEHLQSSEELVLSSRKLLLNHFVAHSRRYDEMPQGLSSVNESLAVLLELEKADKAAVNELLLAPATGSWLAQTVGRLENGATKATPLWVDIGYFANIVAGYASKRGADFTLTTPVIQGTLHVPQQGTALLAGSHPWDMATITNKDRTLRIQHADDSIVIEDVAVSQAQWEPVRRIITSPQSSAIDTDHYSDLHLDILLDDADPYNCGLNPYKISDAEHAEWQATIEAAWKILTEVDANSALQLSAGLSVIIPAPRRKRFEAYSSSDSISIGSIRASLPTTPLEAAEILVHEYCGHSTLNKLFLASPLTPRDTAGSTLYAPWRDDPRPGGGLLHGIYSFSRVVDFYTAVRRHMSADDPQVPLVDFERTLWQVQASDCAIDLKNLWYNYLPYVSGSRAPRTQGYGQVVISHALPKPKLPIGSDPIRGLLYNASAHIAGLRLPRPQEHISHTPLSIDDLAALAKADHRAQWNAHHIKPDPEAIDILSSDWLAGSPATAVVIHSEIQTDPNACRLQGRAILMRQFLADPDSFVAELDNGPELLRRADMALILGKKVMAQALYKEVLADDPLSIEAFVGANLSERVLSPVRDKYQTYPLRRPHVLLAIQKAILAKGGAAPDYSTLVSWLLTSPRSPL